MNPNSSLIWLPAIEAAGLPVPATVVVPYNHHEVLSIFDGDRSAEFDRLTAAVAGAVSTVGCPAFIRTDLSSAKHSGKSAWCIDTPAETGFPLSRLLEDNEMKFWLERDGPKAILVRQFLKLPSPFTAFGGLPVSREWRIFADEEKVYCYHPYWPQMALENHVDEGQPNVPWIADLENMHRVPEDMPALWAMAIRAAAACGGGRWSVDFAQDADGKWWLLDMATMDASWHWPECPNGIVDKYQKGSE